MDYLFSWPLEWPDDYEVTKEPIVSKFKVTAAQARDEMLWELEKLGAESVIITTDIPVSKKGTLLTRQKSTGSEGVAVYFSRQNRDYVIACDRYNDVWDNLRAVGLTIQAIRSMERHGTRQLLEKAMAGFYKALPAHDTPPTEWWRELELEGPGVTEEEMKRQYRKMVKLYHPEQGTLADPVKFSWVQQAYELGKRHFAKVAV